MALLTPHYLDAVAAIGFPDPGGIVRYSATGFLYGRPAPPVGSNLYSVFFVTNRHVFEGEKLAIIRFNPIADLPAREYNLDLLNAAGEQLWFAHSNPDIDIAVAVINVQLLLKDAIRMTFFKSDLHAATRFRAQELGISEGDGVYVPGFPMGLVGLQRNSIIVRHGAIARFQSCLAGHESTFLIDCSIFPGNSGGPVISRPEFMSIEGTSNVTASYLIGIVNAYVPYKDTAVSVQTGQPRITFEENSGLASVFPVDNIDEILDLIPPT